MGMQFVARMGDEARCSVSPPGSTRGLFDRAPPGY